MPTPPKAVVAAVLGVRAPIIAGHVRPDGDCLGSMLALAVAAESAGRCARVTYRPAQVSQRLGFLLEATPHVVATPEEVAACDAAIVLDTARIDRAGIDPSLAELAVRGMPVINIDHHVANPGYGTANWIVPEASSTSELVYRLLVAMGWTITPEAASLLYAGIHTDTHGFSLPNTTASSLHAAAELVAAGAHVSDLCERLWRSQARSEFDLARVIYENTIVTADGRIAYSTARYDEITGTGCTAADIDDQVSIPRALDGIQ
ncbi:MAG: DHH family phosphoesterase, partial [Phycisphaerae bacterium]|nr:DHH family phosphoesterase [Phycisphaerae bacterium]